MSRRISDIIAQLHIITAYSPYAAYIQKPGRQN